MKSTSTKLKNHSRLPNYGVFIFIFLFLEFLFYVPPVSSLNFWNSIYYVLSIQDFGFNSRLLLGSIINIFTNYISNRSVYIIILVITLFFMMFISSLLGKILSNSDNVGVEIFIILFCASPVSVAYLFNINNFGRLDLFLILITITILLCTRRTLIWPVPVLCFLAMLFNQNFAIMYMPVVGIVLLYELFHSGYSKKRLLVFVISCLIIILSFVYFKLWAPFPVFESLAEIKAFLVNKTDIQNGEIVVTYEYYIDYLNYYFKDFGFDWLPDVALTYGVCTLVETAPLIVIFTSLWVLSIRKSQHNLKKLIYAMCLLAPVGGLAMFIAVDWDRWIPTIFISQFLLVFYFISVNDSELSFSLNTISAFFKRHCLIFPIVVIYLASFIFSDLSTLLFRVLIKLDFHQIANNYFPT